MIVLYILAGLAAAWGLWIAYIYFFIAEDEEQEEY